MGAKIAPNSWAPVSESLTDSSIDAGVSTSPTAATVMSMGPVVVVVLVEVVDGAGSLGGSVVVVVVSRPGIVVATTTVGGTVTVTVPRPRAVG